MNKQIKSENKSVKITKSDTGYVDVTFFIDGILYKKSSFQSMYEAEEIADRFLDDQSGPKLLNEQS
jgi:hypothetical protein